MTIPHSTLTRDEIVYLTSMLPPHLDSILEKKAQMVPGSPEYQRAEVAESAVGWLMGRLRDEMRDRTDEFMPHIMNTDLDEELRDLLGGEE